jgi:hypothetical protein
VLAGAVGAVTTNVLHEAVRRLTREAPRVDLLGMQALTKLVGAFGAAAPTGRTLYAITLLGDLASNTLYFALVGAGGSAWALRTGTSLGIVAGVGAVGLPPRLGLAAVTTNRTPLTQALTVGLYVAGGVTAGVALRALGDRNGS